MAQDKVRRDLFLGTDGIERLARLAESSGHSQSEVAREALIAYEVSQSIFRDTVRDAVLCLHQAHIPDEQYDPTEDMRQEEAVRKLGGLLGSAYAAEGVQLALMQIVNQGVMTVTTSTYREISTEADVFSVDEIEESTIPVIEEIGGSVVYDEKVERIDGHIGRYRVVLPPGCTYVGQQAGLNPQTVILPGERRLTINPGQVSVSLTFQAGDSSDSSLWDGAQRLPEDDKGDRGNT